MIHSRVMVGRRQDSPGLAEAERASASGWQPCLETWNQGHPAGSSTRRLCGEGLVDGKGSERRGHRGKKWPKRANEASRLFGMNDLTKKTNPKRTQNEASKSFRLDMRFENEPKTKPVSPLKLTHPLKRTHRASLTHVLSSDDG